MTRLTFRRLRTGPVAAALVALGCGSSTTTEPGMTVAQDVTATWSKAFDAGDAVALAALYADDARSIPPGGAALVGRPDIEAYWRSDLGAGGISTTLMPSDAVAQGNVVHVEGRYEVAGAQSGELASGQYQQLWTRADGDWRLLREMWRMDPTLQPGSELAARLTSSWTAAYNAGDAQALMALYADHGVVTTMQDGSVSGKPAIESFWTSDFGTSKPASTLSVTDAYVTSALAHLEGDYRVSDGATVTEGRYMQLWTREGNAWRIEREMWLR